PPDLGGDVQDDQRRDPVDVVVGLSALGFRSSERSLRPAVPERGRPAQYPRRHRGEGVRARFQAGEEDSLTWVVRARAAATDPETDFLSPVCRKNERESGGISAMPRQYQLEPFIL